MVVRVSANLAELKKNLAEGKDVIEVTRSAMEKLAQGLSGEKLIRDAHNIVAAVDKIGGASRLTEAEQARINATLEKALEKYRVLGKEAPAAMQSLFDATKQVTQVTDEWANRSTVTNEHVAQLGQNARGAGEGMGMLGRLAAPLGGILAGAFTVQAVGGFVGDVIQAGDKLGDLSERTHVSVEALQAFERQAKPAGVELETMTKAAEELGIRLVSGDKGAVAALKQLGLSLEDLKAMRPEERFTAVAAAIGGIADPAQKAAMANELMGKAGREAAVVMTAGFQAAHEAIVKSGSVITTEQAAMLSEVSDLWDGFVNKGKVWGATLVTGFMGAFSGVKGSWLRDLLGIDDTEAALDHLEASLRASGAAMQEIRDALTVPAERGREAYKALTEQVAEGYQQFRGLSEAQREQIVQMTAWGAGVEQLTEHFHVNEFAIQKVIERDKAKEDQDHRNVEATKKRVQAHTEFEASVRRLIDAEDAQIAKIGNKLFGGEDIARAQQYADAIGNVQNVSLMNAAAQREVADVMRAGVEAMVAAGLSSDALTGHFESLRLKATETGRDAATEFQRIQAEATLAAAAMAAVAAAVATPSPVGPGGDNERPQSLLRPQSLITGTGIQSASSHSYLITPRAAGGPVTGGSPYMVGERGPELFVPRTSGTIVPNGGGSAGGGGAQTVIVKTYLDGREIAQALTRVKV